MIVIDSSVVYKWLDDIEEDRDKAKKILQKYILKQEEIIVPDILFYEIANVWATKSKFTTDRVSENLDILASYSLVIITPDIQFFKKASEFSKKYKASVYDASYAVLAMEKKCDLITADEKFVKQVNLPFIKTLKNYSS